MARRMIFLSCVAVLAGACTFKKMVADKMPPTMDDQVKAFHTESSIRHGREAAPAMLKMLDGFINSSPDNPELLIRGAEMNCGFAFLLIEDEDPEWASILYRRGYKYATRILGQRIENFDALLKGPVDDLAKALKKIDDPQEVGPVFWAGNCLGAYVNLNRDDPAALANLPRAIALVTRASELDDTYYFAGAHLFFGMYFGSIGEAVGGNPAAAQSHFDRLFTITQNKFLLGKVYYAMTYAVQQQRKELFEQTLQAVLDAPDDLDPNLALVNAVAKRKARVLLDKIGDLFTD